MEHLKTFRQQLGLSQKDFATLMGCNTGQLAMAESRLRKLPATDQSAILLQQTPVNPIVAKRTAVPTTVNKDIIPALKKLTRAANLKLVRQQLLAEGLETAIEAADNMQAYAAVYQQQKTLPELTRMQLEVLRRKAGEKKARYQLRLLKCRLQMAGFEGVIAKAAELQSQL